MNEAEDEYKDEWSEQVQMISKVPQDDMLLIRGNLNVKVGSNNMNC